MKHYSSKNKRTSKRVKPAIIIVAVPVIWLAAAVLLFSNYVFIGGKLINKNTESIDLTGKNIRTSSLMRFTSPKEIVLLDSNVSVEDYQSLREVFPDCHIRWSVPLSSGRYDNESEEIIISSITEEDIEKIALFPDLKKIEAEGIPDWKTLSKLDGRYASIDVDWGVELGGKYYSSDTSELRLDESVDLQDLTEKLIAFTGLKNVYADGVYSIEDQIKLSIDYPELKFDWIVDLGGREYKNTVTELDFAGRKDVDLEMLIKSAPLFIDLKNIDFSGCGFSNTEMKEVADAFPETDVLWQFSIYDQEVSSLDEEIDFSGKKIDDTSEIENALPYLKKLKKVIMSDCGISDEAMDELNKRHEDVRFVWTVYFGLKYYLRTDATTFIASMFHGYAENPRDLTDENIVPLKYCTDMVALDIGHMYFSRLDFCSEMKDLKWLIISMARVSDLSPLVNCKELYFLEMFKCPVHDLSPLLECKKLRHLNICQCPTRDSLDALAQMTWLERCWMSGGGPFDDRLDREYVYSNEFLPNTMKRLRGLDHTGDGWRNYPAYFEMRDVLGVYYLPTFWSSNDWRNNPNVVVPEGFIEAHGLDE